MTPNANPCRAKNPGAPIPIPWGGGEWGNKQLVAGRGRSGYKYSNLFISSILPEGEDNTKEEEKETDEREGDN